MVVNEFLLGGVSSSVYDALVCGEEHFEIQYPPMIIRESSNKGCKRRKATTRLQVHLHGKRG